MSNSSNSSKNLLLTGVPGCGKTTVAKRLTELLAGLRLAGFLTLELREHGQRVGFQAVGLGGRCAIRVLARLVRSYTLRNKSLHQHYLRPSHRTTVCQDMVPRFPRGPFLRRNVFQQPISGIKVSTTQLYDG